MNHNCVKDYPENLHTNLAEFSTKMDLTDVLSCASFRLDDIIDCNTNVNFSEGRKRDYSPFLVAILPARNYGNILFAVKFLI